MKLDSNTINELVELLRPLMEDERNRRPLLILALGNDAPVLQHITWSGSAASFIPEMVCKLADYSEVASGRQALWALLEYVSSQAQVGVDVQKRIEKLRPLIDLRSQFSAPTDTSSSVETPDIDVLVQKVRSRLHDKIQYQCGTMQLLDVSHPVELDNLYVDVNILEDMPSQRWERIADRLQDFDPTADKFDRFYLGKVRQERVPGLEAAANNSKLMVLGKPGSGKTTFLKHLAIECNKGKFQADHVPIFIGLKRFIDNANNDFVGAKRLSSLQEYISQELQSCDVAAADVERLLKYGRALILLDGLDEVSEQDSEAVRQQIIRISDRYFKNQFALTCRTQAQKYRFESFKYVEVADFNRAQIIDFAKKWFVAVARNDQGKGLAKAAEFIDKLKPPGNKRVRELAVTPILLTLTCLVFNDLEDLPTNRAKLYEQGLDILFTRWDEARGIKRDEVYRNLSLSHKINLLSQIAAITFKQGEYFFDQGKIQQLIAEYLLTLPEAKTDLTELQLDSRSVLKSIEAQHGLLIERAREIYSFSHLTFQEYFTAREIVASSNAAAWQQLVSNISERRWREVFLLTADMLPSADFLWQLMKQQVDKLVAEEKFQQFLTWVNEKSLSVQAFYKQSAVRAFYFTFALDLALDRAFLGDLDCDLNRDYERALALDRAFLNNLDRDLNRDYERALALECELDRALKRAIELAFAIERGPALGRTHAIERALAFALDFQLKQALQQLKDQLPDPDQETEKMKEWLELNGQIWIKQLKAVMLEHRNIGQNWRFNNQQRELLKHYYNANQLLVDCLNSSCQVASAVRQEIEETLLLPIAEIENRRGTRADL